MLTSNYSDVLRRTVELVLGTYPPRTTEAAQFKGYLSSWLKNAWESEWWPELVRIEERTYRAAWDIATAYTAGAQVYHPDSNAYFQALRASTGQAPASDDGSGGYTADNAYWAQLQPSYGGSNYVAATAYAVGDTVFYPTTRRRYMAHTAGTGNLPSDTTYWGVLTDFDPYIADDQTGETEIGSVFAIYSANPRTTRTWKEVPFQRSVTGVQTIGGPNVVWVEFRLVPPQFTGSDWDSDTAYTAGQQVYFTISGAGNFYECLTATSAGDSPLTAASAWAVVEIPRIFDDYMAFGAAADWYRLQGQHDKAAVMERGADDQLGAETDKLYRQQGLTQRLRVNTY